MAHRPLGRGETAVLALNNANKVETSLLTQAELDAMASNAWRAWVIGDADAVLIAFDQDGNYDSPNFLWFRDRYERFVYIDRVIVAERARGMGMARALYEAAMQEMRADGHNVFCCEVNSDPPNPGSDAFHAALGFEEVGVARLEDRSKSVRYLARRV
ncbi:GNAT family N-acetyltransferase [Caulobacter segnis]|uniref:GNAT family N-acetyltransferase n=1 Tax=Caulobacter segnis TaxID=88688 RepID=UPI00241046C4|nr:GNAT family N-acetyltransferase [Caulobacter segnis]MDG2523232.1 GNAT family N-acetyltransferase [Caulobacter segnis]